jgi:hypothetical protein
MSKTELEILEAKIKAFGIKVSSSKKKSEEFLYKIGVTTKNGNLSKNYKNLCTQQDQD